MLNAHQILKLKHRASKKGKMIYEAFKKKIADSPQRKHILSHFDYFTDNIIGLMEIYVYDILSLNEFIYMIDTFKNISNPCIQAFIDGMTLDEADWLVTICKESQPTLEKSFFLITHGYSKDQIEAFAEKYYKFKHCEDNLWDAAILYNVVVDCPDISAEEIKCCASLIKQKRVIYTNRELFAKLLKMKIDVNKLDSFFLLVDTWEYKDEEIIEAFMDVKMLYGN